MSVFWRGGITCSGYLPWDNEKLSTPWRRKISVGNTTANGSLPWFVNVVLFIIGIDLLSFAAAL